jgi:hypothetical protein
MMILALLVALAAPAASSGPEGTISRLEAQSMPREALARRLFGGMSAILLPLSPDDQTLPLGRDGPLRSLVFRTAGHGTSYSGICGSDRLFVEFENAGPDRGAQTRVLPRAIFFDNQFYVLDTTAPFDAELPTREVREAEQTACRAIDPRQSHLIYAQRDSHVSNALRALNQTRRGAQLGTLATPACADTGLEPSACTALLAGIRIDQVEMINECQPPAAPLCYEIQVDASPPLNWQFGAEVRIEGDAAGRITSVAVRRMPVPPPLVMEE